MAKISLVKVVTDEHRMLEFGGELALACQCAAVIFLYGNLGVGKTTLTRGFLRGLQYAGKVKSPTYTLVEPYEIEGRQVFHFDLYRLHDPQELAFIGVQDYFQAQALCLVEWPEHGTGFLPQPDVSCFLEADAQGRTVRMEAYTPRGKMIIQKLISIQE